MKTNLFTRIVLSIILLGSCNLTAQIQLEGASDYGRIYDITYDLTTPDHVYAVTLSNHLILSINNGQDWEVIYSFPENGPSLRDLKNVGNDALSFHVQNSSTNENNTIYIFDIATQQVVKQFPTPDPGAFDKQWVESYSVYEGDSDIAIYNQGFKIGPAVFEKVYYTSDGGSNWTEIYDHLDNDSVFPNNVAISPNDPQKIFLLRGTGPNGVEGGLFVSSDAGANWVEKEAGQAFESIAFDIQNPSTMYIGTGNGQTTTVENVYKSTDGGDNWQIEPITWDAFFLDTINYIAVNPNDSDNVVVLEGNEIAITTDGGTNWTNYIYPDNPNSYYFGLKITFNPFQAGEVFINSDYYPLQSNDGGVTVSQLENPFFLSVQAAVSSAGDQHLYYSVQRGLIHKNLTTNAEEHFNVEDINLVFSYIAPIYFVDPNIEGRVYTFRSGFSGQILYVSDDHGATANGLYQTFFDRLLSIKTDPNDSNKIWLGYNDLGTIKIDFTDISNPITTTVTTPQNTEHNATWIDQNDSNNVIISKGGKLHQTTDGGTNWTDISNGLTLNPFNDWIFQIKQNPNNSDEFVIASFAGIFKSTDAGQNWSEVYEGTNIRNIEYSSENEDVIVASIYSYDFTDAQVIVSEDGGENWIELPVEAIENIGSNSMGYTFSEDMIQVYMSTYDLGTARFDIDLNSLGVNDINDVQSGLIIFPNPSESLVNISFSNGQKPVKVSFYTLTGKEVLSTSFENVVDISSLATGVYLARIVDNTGVVTYSKVVKN